MNSIRSKLYIFVKGATHFLEWELPEFKKYFTLVDKPGKDTVLLSFGPDALVEASRLPARRRFAVLFPGFDHNPVYNPKINKLHRRLIKNSFRLAFINPGPLEIAYKGLENIAVYPFSVDTKLVRLKNYRRQLDSLLHVSNDAPQKDWQRSETIMMKTGLKSEVYPPRDNKFFEDQIKINERKNNFRRKLRIKPKNYLPFGYVDHRLVVKKYQQYDGFVHVARDIKDEKFIDGKYTAALIEAGITGAILFWHDTFGLGNNLETVFNLPLDETKAAEQILNIRSSLDVKKHSRLTHEEMMDIFNPADSVGIRAEKILETLQ